MKMQVSRVFTQGDELVADAARASFDRRACTYTPEQNQKLLNFLAKAEPPHWTPFGHVRVTIGMCPTAVNWRLLLGSPNQLAGLSVDTPGDWWASITHSIWGWAAMLKAGVFYSPDSVTASLYQLEGLGGTLEAIGLEQVSGVHLPTEYSADDISLRITCPIVIARQLFKHTVGFVYSEASGRYITYNGQHMPEAWSSAPDNAKQGAGEPANRWRSITATLLTKASYGVANGVNWLLRNWFGIAPEQARYCLPMSTSTTFVVTGSKDGWRRVLEHRLDAAAQREIQVLAEIIQDKIGGEL